MPTIVDSVNVVNTLEAAPDRLRAEIGRYYSPANSIGLPFSSGFSNYREGIKKEFYFNLDVPPQQLIPTKSSRIFLSGREEQFRDQIQWNEYVQQTIKTGTSYLDHQFSIDLPEIENSMVKNFHDPVYEDFTKFYQTNQLLNYNLISYPFKDELTVLKRVADLETNFDDEDYIVNSSGSLSSLFQQFENRILNYAGAPEEIDLKQRNIFDLQKPIEISIGPFSTTVFNPVVSLENFPFYYSKTLPYVGGSASNTEFNSIISEFKRRKNIMKAIKRDLSFSNRQFNIGIQSVDAKIYDLIKLMTSTSIINMQEDTDELFLVPYDQTDFANSSRRFVDQINSVRFLAKMRTFISNNSRNIEQIINANSCKHFFLGYKIEKYLDNTAGRPIQTYYTNDPNFYDTQLKYGRRYFYKTKVLVGILGSSYSYSNLHVSQNETEMVNENGVISAFSPFGFEQIANEKYRAYVDVKVTPSFQILEYEVDSDSVVFVDAPTLPPQVHFHNNSKKANVEMFFSPVFAKVESVTSESKEEIMRALVPLTEDDRRILNLLIDSKDQSVRPDYFTGIYEVYRMSEPPNSEKDFADHFLTTVDDKSSLVFPESMGLRPDVLDNMNGYFEDFLVPNTKYYYAFRALTYHGTPSNLTFPYEVELLQDSDEYKVNVKLYKYPPSTPHVYEKKMKRLIRMIPNIDRLNFTQAESQAATETSPATFNYKLDDGKMLNKGETRRFKIRITSKHTGKKIDINLNLKLLEDTNSFSQN